MKIYIFVDMEGISGVSGSEFVGADGFCYQLGRQYYTGDINACARGCFAAGADEVIVRDGHGCGKHAFWDQLDQRIELIQGQTPTRLPGIEECEGLILLGYHARAGTRGALLEHTYSSKAVQNMWLNGKLAGEFAFDAGIAADKNIPTIMVSGDDLVCAESKEWVPDIVACQVKTSTHCQGARLLSKEKAHRLIEEKSAEAVKSRGKIKPLQIKRPVTIRKELIERGTIPNMTGAPDCKIIDGRTWEVTGDSVEQAFYRL
jgi:D-amino peptidase